MIWVGIDDTDVEESPGTNQLARLLIERLGLGDSDGVITRHQLLDDPRVPYTSGNGSASIAISSATSADRDRIAASCREVMRQWFVTGSDPGLCVTDVVPEAVVAFGRRCQRQLIALSEPLTLAASHDIHLEGLGGTNGGMIGALAAVGLGSQRRDGRVVHRPGWPWPDPLEGVVDVAAVIARGVEVRHADSGERVLGGRVDLGKHLRPDWCEGHIILFVAPTGAGDGWCALRRA